VVHDLMADTQPVGLKSTWMSTVEYDAEDKSLENTLDDGKTYTNENAPRKGPSFSSRIR